MSQERLDRFSIAFTSHAGYCRHQCNCGKEYYTLEDGIDWDHGEEEGLEARNAIALDHSVYTLCFEGREFVDACDCWQTRAAQLMRFIDGHRDAIASYLNEEREVAMAEASAMPEVTP